MRTLLHVSDLHFGRADASVLDALHQSLRALKPDLVIVSGDLTQSAEPQEFTAAREFLRAIETHGTRYLAIPGNHDIAPVTRPLERVFSAYQNYRAFISENTEHFFHDEEIAVACINTVQRSQYANGRITRKQVDAAQSWLARFPDHLKIVVTHHPLRPNAQRMGHLTCLSGKRAHRHLSEITDVFMSGHRHHSHVERLHALDIHAGTLSSRLRGEPPSFNLVTIDDERISVGTYHYAPQSGFAHVRTTDVSRTKHPRPLRQRIDRHLRNIKMLKSSVRM